MGASFLRSHTTSLIATPMQPPAHRMISKSRIHLAQSVLTNMNIPMATAPPMTTAQTTFNTAVQNGLSKGFFSNGQFLHGGVA